MIRSCYLLFVFLAIQGSVVMGFIENCDADKCRNLKLMRDLERIDWLPTTEEQLDTFCPPVLELLQCGIESIQECTGKGVIELSTSDNKTAAAIGHGVLSIRNILTDICTPGTQFRENYLSSISCLKDLVMDPEPTMKCYQEGHAMFATYEKSKALLGNSVEFKENESLCLVTTYTLACFTSELHDTCGEVARKTFLDTLKRFKSFKWDECAEANIRDLKNEFLDFLELEEHRRTIFSSVFEMKKRRK